MMTAAAPARVTQDWHPTPHEEPPLHYCPQHGGAMRFCGDWCLVARWAFFYASNDLEHYFNTLYGGAR
jgi:hypothetical protein